MQDYSISHIPNGDPSQIDKPDMDASSNGFSHVVSKLRPLPIAAHIELMKGERSVLVANIL